VVVGVPQTSPPPTIVGELVAGFEGEGSAMPQTYPTELAAEVAEVAGAYRFDVSGFRARERTDVLRDVIEMTERRVRLVIHLLQTRDWDLAIWCEIGPDRLHHCFWSDHDPAHSRHDPASPYGRTIREYYRLLDRCLGALLAIIPDDCLVAVVSDHGAQPMQGGVCINEVLRRAGWLVLEREPVVPEPLDLGNVNWSRTRAWAVGGYYARIFLNIAGREPQGVIPPTERDAAREALSALLARLELPGGPTISNDVLWPERIYRRVRGLPPDLMVLFGDCAWRSLGSVGHDTIWQTGNDTGLDEANHARDGLYVLCGRRIPHRPGVRASILDVTPTLLAWLGVDGPPDLAGCNLLGVEAVA
jgi:predicted AlkP superfamily phosphohydrolase/phosphomutase